MWHIHTPGHVNTPIESYLHDPVLGTLSSVGCMNGERTTGAQDPRLLLRLSFRTGGFRATQERAETQTHPVSSKHARKHTGKAATERSMKPYGNITA